MAETAVTAGITDRPAPDLGVTRWIDASGQPLASYGLAAMAGAYKLIFCFQHNCPGCHTSGFPTLARLVQALRGSRVISFAAVQTAFEEFEHNTYEHMLEDQRRYALPIPFGHDEGQGREGAGSVLMQRYRSGGTPWFIIVDAEGTVVYNAFGIDADKLIAALKRVESAPRPEAARPSDGALTWHGVMQLARDGNPVPPRRMELTEAQWRERLTPEQFHVTREHGTERAHSSQMCALFEPGLYGCVCCGTDLFDASTKFDSKSGWPSFTQAVTPDVVAYHADGSHGMQRVETLCNVCDAHLGHVFPDGPPPSGLRYCINALSLVKR
jgi:methionine-R-sulfoxide reductase